MTEKRTCANCACHIIEENKLNKLETQMFCRKNPAQAMQVRVEKPRMINGVAQIDRRTNKPIVEAVPDIAYLYAPTREDLVCFDGWRPMNALPGEWGDTRLPKNALPDAG